MRSTNPDKSALDYVGAKENLRARIDALLRSMPPEVHKAIMALANADGDTRHKVLESVDPSVRLALEAILQHM